MHTLCAVQCTVHSTVHIDILYTISFHPPTPERIHFFIDGLSPVSLPANILQDHGMSQVQEDVIKNPTEELMHGQAWYCEDTETNLKG